MKLTRIELKKYFKHPATYIIAALLVLVMLVSIMAYKPTLATDTSVKNLYISYDVDVTSYNDVYDYFYDITNPTLSQGSFKQMMDSCNNYILRHDPSNKDNNVLNKLNDSIIKIEEYLDITPSNDTVCSNIRNQLTYISSTYLEATNAMDDNFTAVMTQSTKSGLQTTINTAISTLDASGSAQSKINNLKDLNLVSNLKTNLNGFKNFLPTSEDLKIANTYYNKAVKILESLDTQLALLPSENGNLSTLLDYIEQYYRVTYDSYFVITNQIKVSAIYSIGENESKNYIGLDNINTYEYKETVTKHKYLLDYYDTNGEYLDYIEPINISYTYIHNVNIADYVGFVCTLCTFVIIVYISIMGAISVNSEFKSGTMRMIATKPNKKGQIITGKIGATILYGLLLLLGVFIVSFIMGGIAYGFTTPSVLLIFNATTAICCNVLVELLLFLLTLVIQVLLFASLSILISTIISNNIAASLISCVLYFVSIIFNIVNVNVPFLPFTNINLWKYFGGSFLLSNNKNFFALLFNSTPIATNTVIINIISFLVFIIISQIISYFVFKKKEIK